MKYSGHKVYIKTCIVLIALLSTYRATEDDSKVSPTGSMCRPTLRYLEQLLIKVAMNICGERPIIIDARMPQSQLVGYG